MVSTRNAGRKPCHPSSRAYLPPRRLSMALVRSSSPFSTVNSTGSSCANNKKVGRTTTAVHLVFSCLCGCSREKPYFCRNLIFVKCMSAKPQSPSPSSKVSFVRGKRPPCKISICHRQSSSRTTSRTLIIQPNEVNNGSQAETTYCMENALRLPCNISICHRVIRSST